MASFDDRRPWWACMEDALEEVKEQYPELADDDEAIFEIACFHVIPDHIAARIDQMKDERRYGR